MPAPRRIFAWTYAGLAALGERAGYGDRRAEALIGASGRLLIVGLGPGHDLAHLPAGVSQVIAIEPNAAMRRLSRQRIGTARAPVTLVAAVAEALPLPDASVDAALVALVLCSVENPAAAAAELRRVLRAGGTLHVLEHVHAPRGSRVRGWQNRVNPLWSRVAGGCHLTRDTRQTLAAAGFDTAQLRDVHLPVGIPLVAPQLMGVARVAGAPSPRGP